MKVEEISINDEDSIRECRLLCQENYLENLVLLGDLYDPCLKSSQVYAVFSDHQKMIACFTIFKGFKDPSVVLPYGLSSETFSLIMKFLQESLSGSFGFVTFDISEIQLAEFFKVEDQLSEFCMIIEGLSISKNSRDSLAKKTTPNDYQKISAFYQSMNTYAWNSTQLDSGFYFLIEDSEEIVACGGTHLETPILAQLGNIFVHENHRRKGYGKIITTQITREVLLSKKIASLFVLQDNLPAISLYKSLGYRIFKPVSIYSLTELH